MFWASNPTNTWIDNIAAGSEDTGVWFELQKRGPLVDLPQFQGVRPKTDPVVAFAGNEFHSMGVSKLKNTI